MSQDRATSTIGVTLGVVRLDGGEQLAHPRVRERDPQVFAAIAQAAKPLRVRFELGD
jgi:hypothetical protein